MIPLLGIGTTLLGVAVGQLLLGAAMLLGSAAGAPGTGARPRCLRCLGPPLRRAPPGWDVLTMNSGVYAEHSGIDASQGWDEFRRQFLTDSEIVFARDGLTASIVVAQQVKVDNMYLAVNGKIDASSQC